MTVLAAAQVELEGAQVELEGARMFAAITKGEGATGVLEGVT